MIDKIKKKKYWYHSKNIIIELPKEVTVKNITKHIVVFDVNVLKENYADVEVIKHDLFKTEKDCLISFIKEYKNPDCMIFIQDSELNPIREKYPEYFL